LDCVVLLDGAVLVGGVLDDAVLDDADLDGRLARLGSNDQGTPELADSDRAEGRAGGRDRTDRPGNPS
jgi:hypothetical protein